MENYLLDIDVLQRVFERQLEAKSKRAGISIVAAKGIEKYLVEITDSVRLDAKSQYVAKKLEFRKRSGRHMITASEQASREFEESWGDIRKRMSIVPGKQVLRSLRDAVQKDLGVNITDIQIIEGYRESEIPADMKSLIARLDVFRKE